MQLHENDRELESNSRGSVLCGVLCFGLMGASWKLDQLIAHKEAQELNVRVCYFRRFQRLISLGLA